MSGKYFKLFERNVNEVVKFILAGYLPRKVFDDKVIRDAVFGFNIFYKHEINIIDSPLMQRLRRVYQTALAFYTYPSASHSRFEHSLSCVGLAEKILSSLTRKKPRLIPNYTETWAEVRLAALLHDCGHGPFSHASEAFLEEFDEFEQLREENPSLFKNAQAHEILGYFIVRSKDFEKLLWKPITELYSNEDNPFCALSRINLENVAFMIIGKEHPDRSKGKYLAQIVNGPFDVDKLDYLKRDGYFTGLQTAMDVDRLLITLDVKEDTQELCTDISGATTLEQLMFCKMLLFSSVYHHHKVRASAVAFRSLLEMIQGEKEYTLKGLDLSSPFQLLSLNDYDLFNSLHKIAEVNNIVHLLSNRHLPRRALVISRDTIKNEESWVKFSNLGIVDEGKNNLQNENFVRYIRQNIASVVGEKMLNIHFDMPDPPRFRRIALETKVRISRDRYISLDDIYPTEGWVRGYAMYRYRSYIFCPPGQERRVGEASYYILSKNGIKLNEKAFLLAKQEDSLIFSLFPKLVQSTKNGGI